MMTLSASWTPSGPSTKPEWIQQWPPLHPPGPTFLVSGGVLGKTAVSRSETSHPRYAMLPPENSCRAYGSFETRQRGNAGHSEWLPVAFSSRLLSAPVRATDRDHVSVTVRLDGRAVEPGAKLQRQPASLYSCSKLWGLMGGGGLRWFSGSTRAHTHPAAVLSP